MDVEGGGFGLFLFVNRELLNWVGIWDIHSRLELLGVRRIAAFAGV